MKITNSFTYIINSFKWVAYIGVQDSLSDFEKRKLQLINIACLFGGIGCISATIHNLISEPERHNYSAILAISYFLVVFFHYRYQYKIADFFAYYPILIFITIISNEDAKHSSYSNTEYALILHLVFGVLIYKRFFKYAATVITAACFLVVKYTQAYTWKYHFDRYFAINIIIYVVFFAVVYGFVSYFKFSFNKLLEVNKELELKNEITKNQAEELRELNATKDRLFSIIGHDLRSPISSLKGVLNLLNNQQLTQQDFIELSKYLQKNVDNVHSMLENLLQWSHSQMKGLKPNLRTFEVNDIIEETIELFEEVAKQKEINLKIAIVNNLQVFADENQVQTILRNLVNNAIKFTPQRGQVAISGNFRDNFVTLKITNSGIGLQKEELSTLFTLPKIKRGTAGEKGTGLGLILCKELIKQNGGSIAVTSEYKQGATFEVMLPKEKLNN